MREKSYIFLFVFVLLSFIRTLSHCEEQSFDRGLVYHSVNVITGQYCESEIDLTSRTIFPVQVKRQLSPMDDQWQFNLPALIAPSPLAPLEDRFPDRKVKYHYDSENLLQKIEITDPQEKQLFSSASLTQQTSDTGLGCTISLEDGQTIHYSFLPAQKGKDDKDYLISSIIKNGEEFLHYTYCSHPKLRKKLIHKRINSSGYYLINEYYEEGPHAGKVKLQKEPLGEDLTPFVVRSFTYKENKTEVLDALGNKTVYHFSSDNLLTAIEYFLDESLYLAEKSFWTKDKNSKPHIISKTIEDGKGEIHSCQTYEYDCKGQLIKKTLFGNLSGHNRNEILIDRQTGQPSHSDIESFSSIYSYNGHLLQEEREEDGHSIRYFYSPASGWLEAKLYIKDGNINRREFFHYNDNGLIIKRIADNGTTEGEEDLEGITERKIFAYKIREEAPAYGLPEEIEERYLDLESLQERLIKKICNIYNHQGLIARQDNYDADNRLYESTVFSYNQAGKVTYSKNIKGEEEWFQYDHCGNCIYRKNGTHEARFYYDHANRLIKSEEKSEPEGDWDTIQYKYNLLGQKTAQIDTYGNETCYHYDGLGRLIKIVYPAVLDSFDQPVFHEEIKEYDIFNRPILFKDANGYITKKTYTTRGEPAEILHPNGEKETFVYYLNGTIAEEKNEKGSTKYSYFGREQKKEIFNTAGSLVDTIITLHNGFHKTSENRSGNQTFFTYNDAGKQTKIEKTAQNSTLAKSYAFNSLGLVSSIREELCSESIIESSICRDSDQNIEKIEVRNGSGNLLKELHYKQQDDQEQPLLNVSSSSYLNSLGQHVLMQSMVDNQGNITCLIYDARGRPEKKAIKNNLGQPIFIAEMRWDGCGNKTMEVISNPKTGEKTKNTWKYGPKNRLETHIQCADSPYERKTAYCYDLLGRLDAKIKPCGTILHYSYDNNGRLTHYFSSDGTIDYIFQYDLQGNVVEAKDLIDHSTTVRKYNHLNQTIEETLSHGATLAKTYDSIGRPLLLKLPDHSAVSYQYEDIFLKAVKRLGKEGDIIYTHQYLSYDLKGNINEASLIGNIGNISYLYSPAGETLSIKTPYWSEYKENGQRHIIDPSGEEIHSYTFDSLERLSEENDLSFDYDHLGNRIGKNGINLSYNPLNQLLNYGNETFVYDLNGNLIERQSEASKTTYKYDALDRLIQVNKDDSLYVQYTYDAFNRRLSKIIKILDNDICKTVENRYFIYDGDKEIGSLNKEGNLIDLRVLGIGMGAEIGAAIAIEIEDCIYAPIHDSQGSLRCLVDIETSKVSAYYRYTAFGEQKVFSEKILPNYWRYCSKRFDEETGFTFFGKRHYDPSLGRWTTQDPLGYYDGPNPYLYVLNNPLARSDLYGLFSFEHIWDNFCHACRKSAHIYASFASYVNKIDHYINANLSYLPYVRPEIEGLAQGLLGNGMLLMLGFYCDQPEVGVQGEGELNNHLRITFINGILNARSDCIEAAGLISKAHGNINVHYIFHPTRGWAKDMIKCLTSKMGFVSPSGVHLADTWRKLITEMGGINGGGSIIHYAHSIGGTDTFNAKCLLSSEELRMIKVITLGSATIIPEGGFGMVANYVNYRDGVTYLDPLGYINALAMDFPNIFFTGTFWGIPFVDHALESYAKILDILAKDILQVYNVEDSK